MRFVAEKFAKFENNERIEKRFCQKISTFKNQNFIIE